MIEYKIFIRLQYPWSYIYVFNYCEIKDIQKEIYIMRFQRVHLIRMNLN